MGAVLRHLSGGAGARLRRISPLLRGPRVFFLPMELHINSHSAESTRDSKHGVGPAPT
jgi:hypothetical protein